MSVEARSATGGLWRPMRAEDLPAIKHISDIVHRAYSEEEAVYAERLSLYPAGCLTLERDGAIIGYIVTHPWHRGLSPALNAALGKIPTENSEYYLHDIALLPEARKQGLGEAALRRTIEHARQHGFPAVTLVAVNGAERYWGSQGFIIAEGEEESTTYGAGTYRMRLPLD